MNINEFIVFYQLNFEKKKKLPEKVSEKKLIINVMNDMYKEIDSGVCYSFNGALNKIKDDIIQSLIDFFEYNEEYEKCQRLISIKKIYDMI